MLSIITKFSGLTSFSRLYSLINLRRMYLFMLIQAQRKEYWDSIQNKWYSDVLAVYL